MVQQQTFGTALALYILGNRCLVHFGQPWPCTFDLLFCWCFGTMHLSHMAHANGTLVLHAVKHWQTGHTECVLKSPWSVLMTCHSPLISQGQKAIYVRDVHVYIFVTLYPLLFILLNDI